MTGSLRYAPERPRPRHVPAVLAPFVAVGVLGSADVHVATTICRLLAEDDPLVLLAAAFAARAPRVGHACLDIDAVADAIVDEARDEEAVGSLPWPEPDAWLGAAAASILAAGPDSPLVVEGRLIFLRRYHEHEIAVASSLRRRAVAAIGAAAAQPDDRLGRLFPGAAADDPQRLAAALAMSRRLAVLAGGPGTGKTWTIARILAALLDQEPDLEVALAAPTGKAAARLDEGIRDALGDLPEGVRERLAAVGRGQTIDRLLGRRSASRYWHDRDRPLTADVVVVDEMSMTSLALTARLLEAIRPDARVVLVGDPDQLASVEAGSVLADVVQPGSALSEVTVTLRRPRRFGAESGIGALARAIRAGDGDAAVRLLGDRADLTWVPTSTPGPADLAPIREALAARGGRLVAAARDGDADAALAALGELAVVCAHRRGADGVAGWNDRVAGWLSEAVATWQPWERRNAGQPVLARVNDRLLGVFNGDLGVVVAGDDGPRVAFPGTSTAGARLVSPARLEAAEQVHALTIHGSQGSQWPEVVVSLPAPGSRILTRELLYTAVTRAQQRLTVIGSDEAIRAAIARPIRRASALATRLA